MKRNRPRNVKRTKQPPAPVLNPGDIEMEMGVPIPGPILPPDQWVTTAIHRLPEGRLDFESIFGRKAPIVLDIGCGNGRFVVSSAVRRPEVDHLGIDPLPVVIRYATRRGRQRGLANTRFAVCGGYRFLEQHVAPESIAEIHVYHPQPFHDPRDGHLRLLTPDFMLLVHQALQPEGKFFLQTDSRAYWEYLVPWLSSVMDWNEQSGPWEGDPHGRSRREFIATEKGLPIFRGFGVRRNDLTIEELQTRLQSAPMPHFRSERSK